MDYRDKLYEGMSVRGASGAKLGKVRHIETDSFEIEKGVFFKDSYRAGFDEIDSVDSGKGELVLSMARAGRVGGGSESRASAASPSLSGEEARVRLHEEQLEVSKHRRDAGAVKIKKHISTEHKTMSVPLQHESVKVERTAIDREASPGDDFGEQEYTIPLKDEELEVRKRTVVREEVRVAKTTETEMREVSGDLRHEEVEIETADGRSFRADSDPSSGRS